jgi:hypothetical protein
MIRSYSHCLLQKRIQFALLWLLLFVGWRCADATAECLCKRDEKDGFLRIERLPPGASRQRCPKATSLKSQPIVGIRSRVLGWRFGTRRARNLQDSGIVDAMNGTRSMPDAVLGSRLEKTCRRFGSDNRGPFDLRAP